MMTRAVALTLVSGFGAVLVSGALTACGDGPVSPTDCSTLTLTPSSITVPSAGGEGSIAVSARSGCSWQVQTAAAWVQWLSGTSGTGDGTVRYWIGTNVVTAARDATVTAAAAAARITQEAASQGCSYQVTPATTVVPARATGFAIRVFAPFGCRWTFLGNGGWLRVIPDSDGAPNGNGNGTVVGDILENGAEAARTGTAVVAGQLVTVLQDGTRIGACAFTVTPASLDFGAGGGPGRVAVATTDYCHWNALIGGPDYGVVAPSDGTSRAGNGAVDFVVSPNPSAAARQGSLVIRSATGVGEAVLTVNQAGR